MVGNPLKRIKCKWVHGKRWRPIGLKPSFLSGIVNTFHDLVSLRNLEGRRIFVFQVLKEFRQNINRGGDVVEVDGESVVFVDDVALVKFEEGVIENDRAVGTEQSVQVSHHFFRDGRGWR